MKIRYTPQFLRIYPQNNFKGPLIHSENKNHSVNI